MSIIIDAGIIKIVRIPSEGVNEMKIFFGVSVKTLIFGMMILVISLTFSSEPTSAKEREPLMDLERGGIDFFKEISPSIVQVFMGGGGSGYIIDREGHFITNYHVSGGGHAFEIAFFDDAEHSREFKEGRWKATLVGEDPALDLAVMRVEAPPAKFHPVRLGDSALMKPGDSVVTFGSPGGDTGRPELSGVAFQDNWLEFYNLNLGVIAEVLNFEEAFLFASDRGGDRAGVRDYGSALEYVFHTDSAINRGNSGGPCLNHFGEAVGTNTWGFWMDWWGGEGENMGFSVPTNLLKKNVADIIEYGRVRRPWCGISLHPQISPQGEAINAIEMKAMPYNGMIPFDSTPDEMIIYLVNPYSPAYEAGLREGDIITEVNGAKYSNIFDIYKLILNCELGDELVFEFVRGNHGMPPAVVTIDEKRTRFHGRSISIWAGPWGAFDSTSYSSYVTY